MKTKYLTIALVVLAASNIFWVVNTGSDKAAAAFSDEYYVLKDIVDSEAFTQSFLGEVFPLELVTGDEDFCLLIKERWVLVTLFSTIGCSTCLDNEMANVQRFYDRVKSEDLDVAIFGVAQAQNLETLIRFKRASKIAFPVYPDMDDTIIKHLRIKSTPVTFLIDRETGLILAANHPINDRLEWSDLFFDYAVKLATLNKENYNG